MYRLLSQDPPERAAQAARVPLVALATLEPLADRASPVPLVRLAHLDTVTKTPAWGTT